jgi:predicted nucleotidyltransferase
MYEGTAIPEAVVAEAGRRLLEAAPEARVILFGSAARGELTQDSDLDFLVIERDVKDRHAEQVRLRRALRPLRIPVDVIVVSETYAEEWGPAKGSMVHAALTEGRMVHAGT